MVGSIRVRRRVRPSSDLRETEDPTDEGRTLADESAPIAQSPNLATREEKRTTKSTMSLSEYTQIWKEAMTGGNKAATANGGSAGNSAGGGGESIRVDHFVTFQMDRGVRRLADSALDICRELVESVRIVAIGMSAFVAFYGISRLVQAAKQGRSSGSGTTGGSSSKGGGEPSSRKTRRSGYPPNSVSVSTGSPSRSSGAHPRPPPSSSSVV